MAPCNHLSHPYSNSFLCFYQASTHFQRLQMCSVRLSLCALRRNKPRSDGGGGALGAGGGYGAPGAAAPAPAYGATPGGYMGGYGAPPAADPYAAAAQAGVCCSLHALPTGRSAGGVLT
eukprot:scaffold40571_cov18-Tisochrysis_lutea.AAC.3